MKRAKFYNGVTEFKVGIATNACVTPPPPRTYLRPGPEVLRNGDL